MAIVIARRGRQKPSDATDYVRNRVDHKISLPTVTQGPWNILH
jgi:hypothetical protein